MLAPRGGVTGGRMEQSETGWGGIATTVAQAFGFFSLRSPTLKTAIEASCRLMVIDRRASEIIFDAKALLLGFLSAGDPAPNEIAYGNVAIWFRDWLSQIVGDTALRGATATTQETAWTEVETAQQAGAIILSQTLRGLIKPAQDLSRKTISQPEFEARHLLLTPSVVKRLMPARLRVGRRDKLPWWPSFDSPNGEEVISSAWAEICAVSKPRWAAADDSLSG